MRLASQHNPTPTLPVRYPPPTLPVRYPPPTLCCPPTPIPLLSTHVRAVAGAAVRAVEALARARLGAGKLDADLLAEEALLVHRADGVLAVAAVVVLDERETWVERGGRTSQARGRTRRGEQARWQIVRSTPSFLLSRRGEARRARARRDERGTDGRGGRIRATGRDGRDGARRDGARRDEMGRDGARRDEMGRGGTRWEEAGRGGTRWDEVGRGGARWGVTGRCTPRRKRKKKRVFR